MSWRLFLWYLNINTHLCLLECVWYMLSSLSPPWKNDRPDQKSIAVVRYWAHSLLYPPYTKAALSTGKLSPSSGRQAGGYLERFTRSSVMKLIKHSKLKRERYIFKSTFQRCAWNELTKFQECNVIHMSWKVLMNNYFAHSDMFPARKK